MLASKCPSLAMVTKLYFLLQCHTVVDNLSKSLILQHCKIHSQLNPNAPKSRNIGEKLLEFNQENYCCKMRHFQRLSNTVKMSQKLPFLDSKFTQAECHYNLVLYHLLFLMVGKCKFVFILFQDASKVWNIYKYIDEKKSLPHK